MEINAEKFDVVLHKLPRLIQELQAIEKHVIELRQELITAIEDNIEE